MCQCRELYILAVMRLRKIKLAGFKSFADPAAILVSDSLVGIVGPNGCGKSNIIDAVTWVMGESSAKRLRGDALTDVIFNGSSARQPVGQASVELIFDNADGKLGGQYASYSEIAIKRQIDREADSVYYLNGARCRRKDIQDIFLGTGLGPRSYSIIEQGVISRLIEAKPEELRAFLEEAAGISKFRERRRETERRIGRARDNMARVTDLRDELGRQLEHLQRQARAAERYQKLKGEERRLKAELLALNWKGLSGQAQAEAEQVRGQENRVEEAVAVLRRIEGEMETLRDQHASATESLNQAQSKFYQIGGEISQLEQRISHNEERAKDLRAEIDKGRETERESQRQLEGDKKKLSGLLDEARLLEPQLKGSEERSDAAHEALGQAEGAMQGWQHEWDALNQALADADRQIEGDGARLEAIETGLDDLEQRRRKLRQEAQGLDLKGLKSQLDQLAASESELANLLGEERDEQRRTQDSLQQFRGELALINSQVGELRGDYQKNENKIASLEALQYGDAVHCQEALRQWLSALGLEQAPRLIESVEVEAGWEAAFEMVAGRHLQNIGVSDLAKVGDAAASLEAGRAGALLDQAGALEYALKPYPRLVDKVRASFSLEAALGRVYVAEDLAQARKICEELDENESVATRDGVWMNNYWISIDRPGEETAGMLSREQELSRLKRQQVKLAEDIKALEDSAAEKDGLISGAEQKLRGLQGQLNERQELSTSTQARHTEFKTRFEQAEGRSGQIEKELRELELQEQEHREETKTLKGRLGRDRDEREQLRRQRQTLEGLRAERQQVLDEARDQWQSAHKRSHEIALRLEAFRSQRAALEQAIERSEAQVSGFRERGRELEARVASQAAPLRELQQALDAKLEDKLSAESELSTARDNLQRQATQLREKEQERNEGDQAAQARRDQLEAAKVDSRDTQVKLQLVKEQLEAGGQSPQALLEDLDDAATETAWQESIDSLERKIQRLGAINLAAIGEYEQLSERKTYLDSQHEDLSTALETLEGAMRKIDKETRTRFKETFDRLNDNLKENFPLLFGGGHACLEMTEQDLLETGVTVMARPPGKKNSNIHLLSGGEKALTAVALVFSIFQLNPAPFCILDEVDAPLDDNNVSRFIELVKRMSQEVQFIIVTHNKITMELTKQLLGVTMHEAGVSRLVSVDIDEAVEMAESA